MIDHDGSILSVYDKIHLVPFGEYLPFQNFLESLGLMQLTKLPGGFIPGDRRRAMDVPRAPRMLPFICYEIIFPGEAMPGGERPGWMLNLTNDGWFGISSGPYQHLQPGARARDRARTAAGARRQHRHLGGDRSGSAASSTRCRSAPKACSTRAAAPDRCRRSMRAPAMPGFS